MLKQVQHGKPDFLDSPFFEIYNLTGKKIFSKETSTESLKIGIENFKPGLYFMKISADNFKITEKLIVN